MSNSSPTLAAESQVPTADTGAVTAQQWKWSFLAGMASYLDAGSIVALGAGLGTFEKEFGLSKTADGALQAIGPNAIGCAIGAFIGGRLGDKLGRKRIYQYDLLVYAAGILCIACAVNAIMLFIGTFVVGVAVGADVPTSLALVGEFAPAKARGKLLGFTQVAWCLGPAIVLWMAMLVAHLGLLGIRLLFLQLLIISLITWALRQGLAESARWVAASTLVRTRVKALFSGANFRALLWTTTIYLFGNLVAGTAGAFTSYFISTQYHGSQAVATGLYSLAFVTAMLVTFFVFMRFSDRNYRTRRWLWGIGSIMGIGSWAMSIVVPPTTLAPILINIVVFAAAAALAGKAFYKVFSQELFPTMLRGTAQGFSFGVARLLLGFWSFFVPTLAAYDFRLLAALLTLSLLICGVVGFFGMPDTSGKSLEQIETERATT